MRTGTDLKKAGAASLSPARPLPPSLFGRLPAACENGQLPGSGACFPGMAAHLGKTGWNDAVSRARESLLLYPAAAGCVPLPPQGAACTRFSPPACSREPALHLR